MLQRFANFKLQSKTDTKMIQPPPSSHCLPKEHCHQPPSHANCLLVRPSKKLTRELRVYILLLVACAGVTLKAVATALSVPVIDGQVRAEGDLDFRGTLGVDREAPVGFKDIRLSFELKLEREVEDALVDKLLKLTERYCVVLQTIVKKPRIDCGMKVAWKSEDGVEKSLM